MNLHHLTGRYLREIAGGVAGGAISGAVTGALIGSGVGIAVIAAGSFAGGAAGSVTENLISKGAENLDAKTVGIDAAIDGGISGVASIAGFGLGKAGTIFTDRSSLSPLVKKAVTGVKILTESALGTGFDALQDNVNPPSFSDSNRKEMNGSSNGLGSAQDNPSYQKTDRKHTRMTNPPSHWPRHYSDDE